MDLDMVDKTFAITGGTSGLGEATARALVAEGASVILNGRDPGRVQRSVRTLGERVRGVVGDLADPGTAQSIVSAAHAAGGLDGALISMGGPPAGSVLDTGLDVWQEEFDKIFLGTLRLLQAFVPALTTGGAIGVVLSSSVKSPIPNLAVSNGLRPGLAMLVKNLADEVAASGVRVFGLAPGRIRTPRNAALDGGSDSVREESVRRIPLGRLGEPEEFADVAAFMLSARASYMTGCVVPVDGGMARAL